MVSVVLCSPQPILAAGFRQLVESDESFVFSGVCPDLDGAMAQAKSGVDVLVMDVTPDLAIGRLMEIRQHAPDCKLILWTLQVPLEMAHQAREMGIRGILKKDLSPGLTLRCLRKVAEGEIWFDRDLLTSLLEARSVRLSPRERQLVVLVSRGLSNKQIAGNLGIAEPTVKVYLTKLFRKVGVHDRFELALYGLRNVLETETMDASGRNTIRRTCPTSVIVARPNQAEDYADLVEKS